MVGYTLAFLAGEQTELADSAFAARRHFLGVFLRVYKDCA